VGAAGSKRNTSPGSRFYFEPMLTLSSLSSSGVLEEGGREEGNDFSSHAIYAAEAEAHG
jgi:hypothetical protein